MDAMMTPACDGCGRRSGPPPVDGSWHPPRFWNARLVPTYWGETLCSDCCLVVADTYDLLGAWPDPPG